MNSVLIALPDDEAHLSLMRGIGATLTGLDIGLLAVSAGRVRVVFGLVDPDPVSDSMAMTKV